MSALELASWASREASADTLMASVNAPVLAGLSEVRKTFDENIVRAWPDGAGGAYVVIEDVPLGPAWIQDTSWLGFNISYLYPDADIYPHHVRPDLAHIDGGPLVVPFHVGNTFIDTPAVMVSRSSPNRVTGLSTATRKALSVISYVQSHPSDRRSIT